MTPTKPSPLYSSQQIISFFKTLHKVYGPQGWWPVTPKDGNRAIYSQKWTHGSLTPAQTFEMAVGAILTQNTAWTNVEKALQELQKNTALSPKAIIGMPQQHLEKLIHASGYFRQKTHRLKIFSHFVIKEAKENLKQWLDRPFIQARQQLLSLNGIGPETADSILLYGGKHAVFVVDAYTRRLGQRAGWFQTNDYHQVQQFFSQTLEQNVDNFREIHALIVQLAKNYCRTKPRCLSCPMKKMCHTGMECQK